MILIHHPCLVQICPAVSLGMNAWSNVKCEPNHTFLWQAYPLPPAVAQGLTSIVSPVAEILLGRGLVIEKLPYTGFQLHALVMAAFASLVAPFGGFFASGFKRAFNIKDFGDSIPGHGGLTDRFDCQYVRLLISMQASDTFSDSSWAFSHTYIILPLFENIMSRLALFYKQL